MKKIISILLSATMLMGLTACSASETQKAKFEAGTYEATQKGYGGDLTLAVTVSETEITKVEILSHSETAGISDTAIETLPAGIVENQTVALDTVAGATFTSTAILEAAKAALLAAGATEEDITKAVETVVSDELIEKSADIVIIGAGGAGLSAAVEILKAEGSVIVIEKMPSVGGNTILAGSAMNTSDPLRQEAITMEASEMQTIEEILAMDFEDSLVLEWQATLQSEIDEYNQNEETYLFDSPSLHKLQTYIGGDMIGNPEIINLYGDNTQGALAFLEELGMSWNDSINAAVGATWRRSHTPAKVFGASGADFVLPQAEYVQNNGGEILLEHTAEELIVEDGKVVGVKGVTAQGQPFEVMANKNVILATGGFGANIEMRQEYNEYWPVLDETIPTTNHVGATGDGVGMAKAVDANFVDMEWIQVLPTYGGGIITAYIDNQIYLNHSAERFINEDARRDELSTAILSQEKGEVFILSDANTVNDKIASIAYAESKVEAGTLFKADTLEELAELAGLDANTLVATVEAYNAGIDSGNDEFGRNLLNEKIDDAPYYIGISYPMVHHTMGGVEVNTEMQVINVNGEVIEGLYAAGEVTGGLHGTNRLGGNAISEVVALGRIAGQNAMK